MKLALLQAQENLGHTKDNPSVGCVITKNNSVISVGCTSNNGRPHAEYNAINQSKINLKGAKLYVTLEPCSHYGMTPPCTKSIINNRIKKVFFSINDPDFRSHKKSIKLLKKRNIIVNKGICNNEVNSFYKSYIKSKNSLLPFVTCKLAISKDFFTINKKGRWITNKFSRARVHLMRSHHDCIMTSCETIIKVATKHRTIIFYNKVDKKKIRKLKNIGVELHKISQDINNNLDLHETLIKAKELGFYRIFLESGKKMTTSFLYKNLIDDFILFVSDKNLLKNGKNNIKEQLKFFLSRKKAVNEKVNLFGDKLIKYEIK